MNRAAAGQTVVRERCVFPRRIWSERERLVNEQREIVRDDSALPRFVQLARGAAAIHDSGLIHRDLKPQNLLVARYAFGWHVVIVDLGLARMQNPGAEPRSSIAYGTPAYMSPEQASGGRVDARADIYSIGVVLYQMLAGCLPFESRTSVEMLSHHLNTPVQRAPRVDAHSATQSGLEAVALRCLEKQPARRYQTARELLSDLRAVGNEKLGCGGWKRASSRSWLPKTVDSGAFVDCGSNASLRSGVRVQ